MKSGFSEKKFQKFFLGIWVNLKHTVAFPKNTFPKIGEKYPKKFFYEYFILGIVGGF
jgi:hypothetical protein